MTNTLARPTRRTLVRGAAWSVPVVSIAAAAPAFASSVATSTLTGSAAVKWGESNPKHVYWDLTLANGPVAITSVSIVFTYAPKGGGTFTEFKIYSYSADPTTWGFQAIPPSGSETVTATTTGIAANTVTQIHTDFSGADNSVGTVTATATITYADSSSVTLERVVADWKQGNQHPH